MKQPDSLIGGLLFLVGVVSVLLVTFIVVSRRHVKRALAAKRGDGASASGPPVRRRAAPFQMPARWLAVRSSNTPLVAEAALTRESAPAAWSDALSRSTERTVFVSAAVDGWTLLIGGGIPDASLDSDRLYHFLRRMSMAAGEVHFFSADRVLNHHGWVRMDDGRVTRAYVWAGETLWNEGRVTLEERELGLRCRAYCEDAEPGRYGEAPPELHNTERVLLLARRWSIDPLAATEVLLHQEAVESGGDDEAND
jgi:hypothetical protein